MNQVRLLPSFDALFYGFYLLGLEKLYKPSKVKLDANGFPFRVHALFTFIDESGSPKKIAIDARDTPELNADVVRWADVYGKVNLDYVGVDEALHGKLCPIGPSFGVRIWGIIQTLGRSTYAFVKSRSPRPNPRFFFASYWSQATQRVGIAEYSPQQSSGEYIFSLSSLWRGEPATNQLRASYFEACKSLQGFLFEGGFAPRADGNSMGYEELTVPHRYSMEEYLSRTKQSAFVFSTPAVNGCHGWKLAEFLALGKAIVSTRLTREMPRPLEHGKNIHFVEASPDSISDAVTHLARHPEYRQRLEAGAREYYLEYLAPEKVIQRLLRHGGQ